MQIKSVLKSVYNKLFFIVALLLYASAAYSYTRPAVEDRPLGFAAVGGSFLIPACGSTPTYYVTNDTELTAAKGSNRIIIVAPGEYTSLSISGYTSLSIIGENGANIKNISISGSATKNILVRNIAVTRYTGDGFSITDGDNIWIDHCTIGNLVTSSNKESPDGAMDITGGPNFITISWCKIQNAWKTSLHGSSDGDLSNRHITWYANYIVNTRERTPRIRSGETHVINNCYENTGWCRPQSMTANEFAWNELASYKDDGEYLKDRRIITFGYGVMAAYQANAIVENNFFWDVRWPICASRPRDEFELKYGDLQSPDINNDVNSGCIAVKQFGNDYDDSGLLDSMKIKTDNVSSTLCGTMYAPLDYEYVYGGETRWVVKPDMLNPGGRSIKFDEYNPTGVFNPSSYTNYYPAGFVPMTAAEVRQLVPQYAGAGSYQFCPTGAAPTLTTPLNKDQTTTTTIDEIVFTWGGGAIDAKIVDLPAGLTVTKNSSAKTLTISGTPTVAGTYTVVTEGGTGSAVSVSGTITTIAPAPTLTDPANKTQTVNTTSAIESILFTWGGGASDVSIDDLPAGLSVVRNTTNKTLTISGTPTISGTYTVTTVGGTGDPVVISGTITVTPPIVCIDLVSLQINDLATTGSYRLVLLDATGTAEVRNLATGTFIAGDTNFLFSPDGLTSGTYVFKLFSGVTEVKTGTVVIP